MTIGQDREKRGLAQAARSLVGRFLTSLAARLSAERISAWLRQHDL
ncbi:hypothetical protein [Streptomyces rimosus]